MQTSSIVFDIDTKFMNIEKSNKWYHGPDRINYFQLKHTKQWKTKQIKALPQYMYVNYTEWDNISISSHEDTRSVYFFDLTNKFLHRSSLIPRLSKLAFSTTSCISFPVYKIKRQLSTQPTLKTSKSSKLKFTFSFA